MQRTRLVLLSSFLMSAGCALGAGAGDMSPGDADSDMDTDADSDTDRGDADVDSDTDTGVALGNEGPLADGFEIDTSPCLDGEDNDLDGLVDCAELDCMVARDCCAGAGPRLSDGFDGAAVDPARWIAFGAPRPQVADGWISPMGDALFDSGVLSRAVFEPGLEVTVSAAAEVPDECVGACLQTVAVGLTDRDSIGDSSGVDPVVAVVLRAPDARVTLVVDGDVRGEGGAAPSGSRIGVTLGTDGRVEGFVDDAPFASLPAGTVRSTRPLHAAVYGRSPDGASRVNEVEVTSLACANPAGGLRQETPVLLPRVGLWDDGSVGSPSVLSLGGSTVAYYETIGGIGRAVSAEGIAFDREPTDRAVLRGRVGAPGALQVAAGVWLAVESWSEAGRRHIEVFASGDADGTEFDVDDPIVTLTPVGDVAYEDPALSRSGDSIVLYLSMVDDAGRASIGRCDLGSEVAPGDGPVEIVLAADDVGESARDGIAAPAVLTARGYHEMWFEERDGIESRIRYAVSGDGIAWEVLGETILGPARGRWDGLAVGDPSALLVSGKMHLYYAGTTGSSESIGLVARVIPWSE